MSILYNKNNKETLDWWSEVIGNATEEIELHKINKKIVDQVT